MTQTVSTVYFNLQLLMNRGDSPNGGTILIDTYSFDPGLKKGDIIHVEEFKVGFSNSTVIADNHWFKFEATVMDVQKTVTRHQHLTVNIILESPDKETIAQIGDALNARNPE